VLYVKKIIKKIPADTAFTSLPCPGFTYHRKAKLLVDLMHPQTYTMHLLRPPIYDGKPTEECGQIDLYEGARKKADIAYEILYNNSC
jgi:hypothetical protein